GHQLGAHRRRRRARPSARPRRAALERRYQLHAGARQYQSAAGGARSDLGAIAPPLYVVARTTQHAPRSSAAFHHTGKREGAGELKITDVKASIVFGRSIFVQVFTDEGITGLGECSPM